MNNREQFAKRAREIPTETLERLDTLRRELFQERRDGGLDFSLNDHLWQAYLSSTMTISVEQIASNLGIPESYILELQQALSVKDSESQG